MPITSNDVVRARVGDCFLDRTGLHWDILDKWPGVGYSFCFQLHFSGSPPMMASFENGIFRIIGETPIALDDLNHPAAKFEKKV